MMKLINFTPIVDKLYAYLYLGEYWLFNADLKKAEESVEDLEDFFEQSQGIPKRYSLMVNMAKTELEMMKRFNSNM
ncbi:hypothetical protein [Salegentibacter chungangensis]|uniref:Uncharacterized protein n=1 Tax=Salegentibacter chungangensis TaxID=1335724 RepID=A0ABW3NP81_9FLAO